MSNAYQPFRGVITKVALRDDQGELTESTTFVEGLAANIFYEVTIDDPHGPPIAYRWVSPCHQRISTVIALKSGRVGDECVVTWSGNEPRFHIAEGMIDPNECGAPPPPELPPLEITARLVDRSVLTGAVAGAVATSSQATTGTVSGGTVA